jgi:ornithine cyclodeaminase/alanine dehydrogenase-like protein (mu-crystallin family)
MSIILDDMKIAWIGGLDRNERALEQLAESAGHKLLFHCGDVRGRGADELRGLVKRSDVVVVVTSVNSHGGVLFAKKAARQAGRPVLISRSGSSSMLEQILAELPRVA